MRVVSRVFTSALSPAAVMTHCSLTCSVLIRATQCRPRRSGSAWPNWNLLCREGQPPLKR